VLGLVELLVMAAERLERFEYSVEQALVAVAAAAAAAEAASHIFEAVSPASFLGSDDHKDPFVAADLDRDALAWVRAVDDDTFVGADDAWASVGDGQESLIADAAVELRASHDEDARTLDAAVVAAADAAGDGDVAIIHLFVRDLDDAEKRAAAAPNLDCNDSRHLLASSRLVRLLRPHYCHCLVAT